ncbi:MAG: type II restriction endonuclease [Akkermansia sp.]|nr:type II restriction endonuclease [Akkermansia sp.]
MKRNFSEWLATMRSSINSYSYYVDFQKVYDNVDSVRIELNILNSLIGVENIRGEFLKLVEEYPKTLRCVPILLACRQMEIYAQDEEGAMWYDFSNTQSCTPEQYADFMEKTGLFDLISNHIISNLKDYVTGVEVGLDSNGRKNRGGHQMEDLVEKYLQRGGYTYYKEMYLQEVEKKWNLDLSALSGDGISTKRFDFVVDHSGVIYLIETNFYTSGGSKLNETARSYKLLAQEVKKIQGVEFVWITDGAGWKSARRNLEETFNELEYLFNIADIQDVYSGDSIDTTHE